MEKLRGSIGGAVSSVLVAGVLLSGCAQRGAQEATSTKASDKQSAVASDKNVSKSLQAIKEKFEGKSHLLVLEKAYWVNKRIWVSIGVEKASVTGMAGSVMGYIPAYVRQQNGLLVLERDNAGRFAGTVLTPDVALNAYPIVDENDAAIVVDIANPRTEYGLTNMGFYAGAAANTELKPRLEYVKTISIKDDGIAFDSVVNAVSPVALYQTGTGAPEEIAGLDPYSISLTIRTDWKIPNPTADYVPLDSRSQPVGFFLSTPIMQDGGNSAIKYVSRIATSRQHVWEMSANTPAEYQNAVRDGIMAWNDVLGGNVLDVRLAQADKDFTDPSTSNVTWDDNKAVGFAFANWRSNPQTGEIMQGQVYMSGSMWAEQAGLLYDLRNLEKLMRKALEMARKERAQQPVAPKPAPTPTPAPTTPAPQNPEDPYDSDLVTRVRKLQKQLAVSLAKVKKNLKSPALIKRGFVSLNPSMHEEIESSKGFCQQEVRIDEIKDIVDAVILVDDASLNSFAAEIAPILDNQQKAADGIQRVLQHMPYPAENVTREQFQYDVIRAVVMHEVGHTLGLRHNFMGSLETSDNGHIESGSIMDYNDLVVAAQFNKIGDSDRAVMEMGYKRIPPTKDHKICTDEHVQMGVPGCFVYDYSSDSVDYLMTSQETDLILGLYFGQRGDMSRLVNRINSALRANINLMTYVNFPKDQGTQLDPNFGAEQMKAFSAVMGSRKMYDLPFPDTIVSIYSGLSRLVLDATVSDGATQGLAKAALIADMSETVADAKGVLEKDTRLSGVVALQKLQDASARNVLKGLVGTLNDSSIKPDAERNLESRMMDEYVQNAVKNTLDSYYTVGAQGKP